MAGAVEPGAVMRDTVVTHQTDYRATRPKVERKLGHLLRRRHGGRCARVRGKRKVDADFNLLAAVHCPQPRAPRCARAALDNVRMGRGQRMRTRSRHLRRRRSPPKRLREQQRPVRRRGRAPAGQPVVGHIQACAPARTRRARPCVQRPSRVEHEHHRRPVDAPLVRDIALRAAARHHIHEHLITL